MSVPKLVLILVLANFLKSGYSFDSVLDTHTQTRRWKFDGNYTYANSSSSSSIKELRPPILLQPGPINTNDATLSTTGEFEREGIWLIKHEPEGRNKWNMSYSMSHLLFAQAWVTFLAHPNVEVIFKSSNDEVVGRFWSDGKSWCDAILNVGLRNTFTAEVSTPNVGDYALIDKVVLGIMGNITALKKKKIENPCMTTPMISNNSTHMTDQDNELKRRVPGETGTSVPAPEMKNITRISSPTVSGPSSGTPSRRTYQTERGGAKCDCVCTCAKPNQTSNSTFTTTIAPPTTRI